MLEIFNFIEGNHSQDQEVANSSENQIDEDFAILQQSKILFKISNN
jgi:hypothetical protein